MSDMKLTNEKMRTFECEDKIGFLKAGEKLAEFGEKQNTANEALAYNVNDLIRRICALEEKQIKNEEIMRKMATEIASSKKELDRIRLSDKLNTSAIARLNNALNPADVNNDENSED